MKSRFSSINFHSETVQRFKGFCHKIETSYTETLEHMLDFFDKYQLSPLEDFGPNIHGMETAIKNRINGLVAIIKDIEKHQTKPTTAMLKLLFEQTPPKEKPPRLVEARHQKKGFREDSFATSLEAIALRKEKNIYKQELQDIQYEFAVLLHKVRIVKSSFGKPRLQLDISLREFEELKQKTKRN